MKTRLTYFGFLLLFPCFLGCNQISKKIAHIHANTSTLNDIENSPNEINQEIHNKSLIYEFNQKSKLVKSIPVGPNAAWDNGKVIYSITLPPLKKGDIIVTKGILKAFTTVNYNVAFGAYLILSPTPGGSGNTEGRIDLSKDNGFNISSEIHQGFMEKMGTYECTENLPAMYLNFCCKAYSSGARIPADSLFFHDASGNIWAGIFRPEIKK